MRKGRQALGIGIGDGSADAIGAAGYLKMFFGYWGAVCSGAGLRSERSGPNTHSVSRIFRLGLAIIQFFLSTRIPLAIFSSKFPNPKYRIFS